MRLTIGYGERASQAAPKYKGLLSGPDSNTANNAIIALACMVSNGGLSLESNTPPQGINPEFLHAWTT
jgi:hypothetical protein